MKNITILVATHKKYQMPKDDIYVPIQVGSLKNEKIKDYIYDDQNDNISGKNPYYCELTGLYWAWKNLNCEYIGLAHYRRHFSECRKVAKTEEQKFQQLLTRKQIEDKLEKADIVLPKKRNYYIENLYDHYKHTLYVEPLDKTRDIIQEIYPKYLIEFDKLKKRKSAHMFNMFIMKKEIADEYCKWLFEILFELEKRVDVSQYDSFHARFFGRVSELLLDVWINTNGYKYEEIKVIDMNKIDWGKKIKAFLKSKFTENRYDKSF